MTLAETRFGIERLEEVAKRGATGHWLDHVLRPWFAGRILEVDERTGASVLNPWGASTGS